MLRVCPHPECSYVFSVLTNNHCKTEHGMTRDQLIKKYGNPQRAPEVRGALKRNLAGHVSINQSSFFSGIPNKK